MQETSNITGIEALMALLPEAYHHWHKFGKILRFSMAEVLDEETLDYQYNGEMIITDTAERYKIRLLLKDVHGHIEYYIGACTSGFEVLDLSERGFEPHASVFIGSFEPDCCVNLNCMHVHAELMKEEELI